MEKNGYDEKMTMDQEDNLGDHCLKKPNDENSDQITPSDNKNSAE